MAKLFKLINKIKKILSNNILNSLNNKSIFKTI
jgi:hypothetical protein